MNPEKSEDKIVRSTPFYLSNSLLGHLHIFQYPVRPHFQSYDEENISKCQIKPNAMQVEMEVEMKTKSKTYDRNKGEQIASSVDGAIKDRDNINDGYFSSHTMDKLVLTSTKVPSDMTPYGIAVMRNNALHLIPLTSVLSFRPSFDYLDKANLRSKRDRKEDSEGESEAEESATKVTVRFERPETEHSKAIKEKSFSHHQRKTNEESWIPLEYNKFRSTKSEFDSRLLYCTNTQEDVAPFNLDNASYLHQLISPSESPDTEVTEEATLLDKLRSLMLSAKVASFDEILKAMSLGRGDQIQKTILEQIKQVAVLVQGNWVVKSDLLYPKDADSETPNEIMQKIRDCMLYLFTKSTVVKRSTVAELLSVPDKNLAMMFKGVSVCKGERGTYTFMLPTDDNFNKKNLEVSKRQEMIWQAKYEQLIHSFRK